MGAPASCLFIFSVVCCNVLYHPPLMCDVRLCSQEKGSLNGRDEPLDFYPEVFQ